MRFTALRRPIADCAADGCAGQAHEVRPGHEAGEDRILSLGACRNASSGSMSPARTRRQQRLVHELHAEPPAGGHGRAGIWNDLLLADQLRHRRRHDQDLDHRPPAAAVGHPHQFLADHRRAGSRRACAAPGCWVSAGNASTMRSMVWAAPRVCRVPSTRWPVSAASSASAIVSGSRSSPTMITSGSCAQRGAQPVGERGHVSLPTSRWMIWQFWLSCTNSIGSSSVRMVEVPAR